MIQQLSSVNGILVVIFLLFIGKEGRAQIDTSHLAFYLNDVDLTSKELIIRKAVKGFNIGGYLFEINDTKLGLVCIKSVRYGQKKPPIRSYVWNGKKWRRVRAKLAFTVIKEEKRQTTFEGRFGSKQDIFVGPEIHAKIGIHKQQEFLEMIKKHNLNTRIADFGTRRTFNLWSPIALWL